MRNGCHASHVLQFLADCGIFEMQDSLDVECLGCGVWNVCWDVGCWFTNVSYITVTIHSKKYYSYFKKKTLKQVKDSFF